MKFAAIQDLMLRSQALCRSQIYILIGEMSLRGFITETKYFKYFLKVLLNFLFIYLLIYILIMFDHLLVCVRHAL